MAGTLTLTVGWNDTITVTNVAAVRKEGAWLISTGTDGAERRTSLYVVINWQFLNEVRRDDMIYPSIAGGVGYAMCREAAGKSLAVLEVVP
jgi:hypothetical protein